MAITKERLEELIKEGATVYYNYDVCVQEKTLNKTYEADSAYLWRKIKGGAVRSCGYSLEDLFETKEDAEFAIRYQNITRTETLSLPTWEEFCKMEDDKLFFYKGSTYILRNDVDEIKIIEQYYDNISYIFNKSLTKENYLEACELCRKLFLDEEV